MNEPLLRPRIGLLTGTFDPVHRGHIALAKAAMKQCELAEVWFLVNPAPQHKPSVLPYAHRLAMVRLALQGESALSTPAAAWDGLPHTLEGFEELMVAHAAQRFVFIVGMDTIGRLDTWHNYPQVVRSQAFVVARRYGVLDDTLTALRGRLGDLGAALQVQVFELSEFGGAASGDIRARLAGGDRLEDIALHPAVKSYIEGRRLYH